MSLRFALAALCAFALVVSRVSAQDAPKAIPENRAQIKQALEALKRREPRLPLPPATEAEIAEAKKKGRFLVANGRMRQRYLPAAWFAADFKPDPAMTLENGFKVSLFWIVSRGNNCQYCLGHQEHKLGSAGWDDDRIASLDGDWSGFSPAEKAAMAFTRKITLAPHTIGDDDVATLLKHYDEAQTVEIVHTVAMYNSVNRWTDGLGIPQDEHFRDQPIHLDTPTSPKFATVPGVMLPKKLAERPELESREEVARRIAEATTRSPRVPLPSEEDARKNLGDAAASGKIPAWERALSRFPTAGAQQVRGLKAIASEGRLPLLLKAQIARTTARHNRAWHALAMHEAELKKLGQTDEQIAALDGPPEKLPETARAAIAWAEKSTVDPQKIVDADVKRLRAVFSDHETAEVVYATCASNYFDRLTEALALPVER